MERLKGLLFEASVEGSVSSLLMLLREDPLILDRVTLNLYNDTPLHVASILGHVDFVKAVLVLKPKLAMEFNSQRYLPLHMAAAKGHLETVKELVSANPDACLVPDRDGRNPLHLAAIRGREEVLKELVTLAPHAARAMVQDETILHLCVQHNQLEALKFLVETISDHEFVNSKDADGNTVLHLAVADKQIETIKILLQDTAIEVNALNLKRDTAMDILVQGQRDARDIQIRQSLLRFGSFEAKRRSSLEQVPEKGETNMGLVTIENHANSAKDAKKKDQWLESMRNSLMVVASLIATMAFQAGINPSNGVWQDDFDPKESNSTRTAHSAGDSIMADKYPDRYNVFLVCNTVGFVSSLSIILLLISGLPFFRHRVFVWLLVIFMWIAIVALLLTYFISISVLIVSGRTWVIFYVVSFATSCVCIGLTALFLLGHTIPLIVKAVRKLRKLIMTKRSSSRQRGGNEAAGSAHQTTVQMPNL